MLKKNELPCENDKHPADYFTEQAQSSPSFIWLLLTSKKFWLYSTICCGAGLLTAHFGFACVGAIAVNACYEIQKNFSSTSLMLNTSLLVAAVSFFKMFHPKSVVNDTKIIDEDADCGYEF